MSSSKTNTPAHAEPLGQTDAAVDLLSDLESRLGALKNWQSQSEAQAEKVRERSKKLEDRQGDLDAQAQQLENDRQANAAALLELEAQRKDADQLRETLDAERAELDHSQSALKQRREDLEAHATDVEADLDAKHRELEADEKSRLAAVETQELQASERLAQAQQQLDAAQARKADLDQQRQDLDDAQAELDRSVAALDQRAAQADQRDEQLDARQARLDQVAQKLEAERAKLDERAADLEAKAKELDRLSDELHAELRSLEDQQADLDQAKQTLEAEQAKLEQAHKAAKSIALEHQLREEELQAREQSLAKSKAALLEEAASGKLEAQALESKQQALDEQAEQLQALREANDVAAADLQAARDQSDAHRQALELAQAELTQANQLIAQRESELTALRDQLDLRVDELAELRDQLDAAQAAQAEQTDQTSAAQTPVEAESPDDQDALPTFTFDNQAPSQPSAADSNDDATDGGLERLQALVEEREIEIADLRSQLEAQTGDIQTAQARAAELESLLDAARQRADDAEQQLEHQATLPVHAPSVDPDAISTPIEQDARAEELTEQLAQRDEQLEDARHDLDARAAEVDLLRQRIEELTEQARAAADTPAAAALPEGLDPEDLQRQRDELDEQAAQIAADRQRVLERKAQLKQADEIIKKRREKIREYISAAKDKAGTRTPTVTQNLGAPLAASDAARLAGLNKERAALAEVKLFLEQSEAAMVQRWATQKTGSLVTSTVIAVILAVGFSFFVGSQIAQPVYRATMAIEVQPQGDATDMPPGAWINDYKQTLLSEPVLAEALNQMDQRGIRIAGTPQQLEAHLRDNLAATGTPQRVELVYFGSDSAQIGGVLEAYGRGLLDQQEAEDRRAGRLSNTARVLQPAAAESDPVQDDRLKYALATFAAIVAAVALLALPLRLLYGRSQRILHENNMPELAMLNDVPAPPQDAYQDEPFESGIQNDGPPAGFARLPQTEQDEANLAEDQDIKPKQSQEDEDDEPEQVFRF